MLYFLALPCGRDILSPPYAILASNSNRSNPHSVHFSHWSPKPDRPTDLVSPPSFQLQPFLRFIRSFKLYLSEWPRPIQPTLPSAKFRLISRLLFVKGAKIWHVRGHANAQ